MSLKRRCFAELVLMVILGYALPLLRCATVAMAQEGRPPGDEIIKSIRGSWTIEYDDSNGMVMNETAVIEFSAEGNLRYEEKESVVKGRYSVRNLRDGIFELDLKYDDGSGFIWKCLAKISDGKLCICMHTDPGGSRPRRFLEKLDKNGAFMILHPGR